MTNMIAGLQVYYFLVWIFFRITLSHSGLPNTYTVELVLSEKVAALVATFRYNNSDLPSECRQDYCTEIAEMYMDPKGMIEWPNTVVGMRRFMVCPFAHDDLLYAYKDCQPYMFQENMIQDWLPGNNSACPEQPLHVRVRAFITEKNRMEQINRLFLEETVRDIFDIIVKYPDDDVISSDVSHIVYLCNATKDKETEHVLGILDYLLASDNLEVWIRSTMILVSRAANELDPDSHLLGTGRSFAVKKTQVDGKRFGPLEWYCNQPSVYSAKIAGSFQSSGAMVTAVMFEDTKGITGFIENTNANLMAEDTQSLMDVSHITELPSQPSNKKLNLYRKGPVVYLNIHNGHLADVELNLTFNLNLSSWFLPDDNKGIIACGHLFQEELVHSHAGPHIQSRYSTRCVTVISLGLATCRCNSTGYFSLFSNTQTYQGHVVQKSLDNFLGFPAVYELYIISHILRAISLVCLLITVLSYIIFRNVRHGTATIILLNLCVSLIVLTVVLYVTLAIGNSKDGCRARNLLLYYLILVTLLWNGIEAVNMYLKLVKVFKTQITRFTTKAAIVAWGVPLVPVLILVAIDTTSFDGHYIDCNFRCLLKPPVLYYALLVPLGIIMLLNLTAFGIVFRVIFHYRQTDQKERKNTWLQRLIGAVALLVLLGVPWVFGAFGAIDADGNRKMALVEGIFQVIFVVLINAQGIFIFGFHCARNSDIRAQWKSSLSKLSTKSSTLSSNSDAQKRSRENVNVIAKNTSDSTPL